MAREEKGVSQAFDERERIRAEIEEEVRTLGQKAAFVLHPDQVELKPCATIVFGPPRCDPDKGVDPEALRKYEQAVEAAGHAPEHWTEGEGRYLRHFARFQIGEASRLFDLYQAAGYLPESQVLIHDLPLPYARDLWLPQFWFYRK